jgi:hypothetical protein
MAVEPNPALDNFRTQLAAIERDLDEGSYKSGPWGRLIANIRNQPDGVRAALASDISRVSRKLNLRTGRGTLPVAGAMAIELAAAVAGGLILAVALARGSSLGAIAAMAIWVTAFQPLVKVSVGIALGIGYEYAYLFGIEPRFKMNFGSYLAAARWKRIALHLSGMVGSPGGAMIVASAAEAKLPITAVVCWVVFWILVSMNVIPFVAAVMGVRRLGRLRMDEGSGGSAGIELRDLFSGCG